MNTIPTIAPMPFPEYDPKPTFAPMHVPELERTPNEKSTLEELVAYALLKQQGIYANDKKNAEDMWFMGEALTWAFKKIRHGKKEDWLESQGFKKTYAWQARQLYKKATLEQVKQYGLTEALREFNIVVKKKKTQAVSATTSPTKQIIKAPAIYEVATEPTDEGGCVPAEAGAETSNDPAVSNGEEETAVSLAEEGEATVDLVEEEARELKEHQANIRTQTPNDRAVAILHAMELLRDDLNGKEIDEELRRTLSQIAALAEGIKGGDKQSDLEEAA